MQKLRKKLDELRMTIVNSSVVKKSRMIGRTYIAALTEVYQRYNWTRISLKKGWQAFELSFFNEKSSWRAQQKKMKEGQGTTPESK